MKDNTPEKWESYMDEGEYCPQKDCNGAPFRFIDEGDSLWYQCLCGEEWSGDKEKTA